MTKDSIAACLIFFISLTSSSTFATEEKPPEKIILQLKWRHQFQFAGYYAAIEKGFYSQAGLEVTLKEGRPGMWFADEVVSGRANYGIDMPVLLIERSRGMPVVVLAAIFQHSPEILLTLKDSGLTTPQDLVGRKIELRPKGNSEIRAMFLSEGIPLDRIKIVRHSWGLEELISGRVDASSGYITDRPFFLQKLGIPYNLIRPLTYGIDFYGDCIFTSEKEIREHPQRVKAFLRASLRGWAYTMQHPEEIIDLIIKKYNPELSRDFLRYEAEETRKLMLPKFIEIGHMNPGRWKYIADTFVRLGMLDRGYSLDGFLYNPNPHPDFTWMRRSLLAIFVALLLISFGAAILFVFNRRLKQAVEERTAALSKANKLLAESEQKYREIFNSTSDAIFIHDAKTGTILDVNQAMLDLYGFTKEEALSIQVADASLGEPPYSQKEAEAFLKKALTEGRQVFEWRARRKNGELFWVEVVLEKSSIAGKRLVLAVVRDITERKKVEDALRESETRYRTLFDSALDAILLIKGRNIVDCNKKAIEMFGSPKDQIIGKTILDFAPPSQPDGLSSQEGARRRMESAYQGETQFFEWRHRRLDGTEFDSEVRLNVIELNGEKYLQAIIRDVTERKLLEDQLRHAMKMEAVGRLSGGIAHDFNNLLTTILGYSEIALMDLSKDNPTRDNIKAIYEAGERAAALTRQLLAFSRKQVMEMKTLDLNTVIGNMANLLCRLIGEDVQLSLKTQAGISKIKADPGQLEQIIMNLVVNARDAMPEGGRLTIGTREETLTPEYANTHPELEAGRYVVLSVSDTGVGMSEEVCERIFEPFFTTKEVGKGTGLGLATVYGIIKQHNGHVSVHSEPDKGTTFKVYFPAAKVALPEESRDPEPRGKLARGTETILVVDDEPSVRQLVLDTPAPLGYKVVTAENGVEALRLCEEMGGHIDLLLTDVIMPGMNGRELSERLKSMCPRVKVAFMSGYADNVITRHGVPGEGIIFIDKPLHPSSLSATLREILDQPDSVIH